MNEPEKTVTSLDGLITAVSDRNVRRIVVKGEIAKAPSLRLNSGQQLLGEGKNAAISFLPGVDGLQLSMDNEISGLALRAGPEQRAIFNDTSVESLGRIVLNGLSTTGQVQILARQQVRGGHVSVRGLHVEDADARARKERPHGFGVDVLQGAFTLYNLQPDDNVVITAELLDISAGREGAPVRGSGVFVSGAGDTGGRVRVTRLETGAIFSDGKIPPGTANLITGGVFLVYGAHADEVRNRGPVTTYGVNDMVLDNWGDADRWIVEEKLTSHGPSGIGFVNFGTIDELRVRALIETFGLGARGFNEYTGYIESAEFDRIVTHADAGVGVQISRPVGRLIIRRGIETNGGTGNSLVKGKIVQLAAYGLSVLPEGRLGELRVEGGIVTHGKDVPALQIQGEIGSFQINGGIRSAGMESAVH
ncbi:MAG: hypothetical protein WCC11_03385 [Gammaproteobacteria bacterium]